MTVQGGRATLAALNRPIWRITGLLVLIAVLALGLRLYMGREAEDRLLDQDIVVFQSDIGGSVPGMMRFFACPIHYCGQNPDMRSPVYDVSWERLRDAWSEMIAREKRVKLLAGDDNLKKISYIQHTKYLKFPDIITVEFIPLGEKQATLAIESHSRYGSYDFGANGIRIRDWLKKLDRVMADAGGR